MLKLKGVSILVEVSFIQKGWRKKWIRKKRR